MLFSFSRKARKKILIITGLPVNLTSALCKIMEKIVLGVTEKHLKDNLVAVQNHHKFMRERSCLTNTISFYETVTHLVD